MKAIAVSLSTITMVMLFSAAKCGEPARPSDEKDTPKSEVGPSDQGTQAEKAKPEVIATEELFTAIKANNIDGVEKALASGAKLEATNTSGDTPLIASVKEAVKQFPSPVPCKLATNNASINQKDKEGKSALQIAFEKSLAPVILCLIENGADHSEPIFAGLSPWDWAIKNDKMKLAEALAKAGEAKRKDLIDGVSPLVWSIVKEKTPLAMAMLENGADPNYGGDDDEEPIFFALNEKNFEVAEKIVSLPQTDLNVVDQNLDSPLHRAVALGRAALAEKMLARHANPNAKNRQGKTPLHLAYASRQWSIAQRLLENGAQLSIKDASAKAPASYGVNWLKWDPAKISFGRFDSNDIKKTKCLAELKPLLPSITPDSTGAKLLLKESVTIHPDKCQAQDLAKCSEAFTKLTECRQLFK